MLSSFRNLSKSTVGSIVLVLFLVLVVASFALADLANFNTGFGGNNGTIAKGKGFQVTERQLDDATQQRLRVIRQTNPEAQYADLEAEFDSIITQLIQEGALGAFAEDNGFLLSKALVDAEIGRLPGVQGLDGQFTPASYQAFLSQQQLTDGQLRNLIRGDLYRRLLVIASLDEMRVPTELATPYASILLEEREGNIATIAANPLAANISVTDDEVADFYNDNSLRYTVPEQRVLRIARIDRSRFADLVATEAEIDEALADEAGEFGPRDVRVISQVVVPTEAAANQIATAARAGSFVDAVAPAGFSAADVSIGPQTRAEFVALAGEEVASAAFAADVDGGDVVGPIQSALGYHVVRVEEVRREEGVSEANRRAGVATALTERKRTTAIEDLVIAIEDAIADGASFAEAAAAQNLEIVETPPITAAGRARDGSGYTLPEDLQPILRSGFELETGDEPVVETLGEGQGYAVIGVEDILEAAPAPLANIRDQVRNDLIRDRALERARELAQAIKARVDDGEELAAAVAAVAEAEDVSLPGPESLTLRRLDLAQLGGNVPTPLQMLFRLPEGSAQIAAEVEEGGIFVVKAERVVPGNAVDNPGLITQTARGFQDPMAQELGQQFIDAIVADREVTRNDGAIARTRDRIIGGN